MWFLHWLNNSWNQIWPNLVAGLVPTGGVAWSHVKRVNLAKRHHADLKAHVAAVAVAASAKPVDPDPGDMLE